MKLTPFLPFLKTLVRSQPGARRSAAVRRCRIESLEKRSLMASDISHNFIQPTDVDDDGSTSPLDALVVINQLNSSGGSSSGTSTQFLDTDDDAQLSPLDALRIINEINRGPASPTSILEASRVPSTNSNLGLRIKVELESEGAEQELKIRLDRGPASTSLPIRLSGFDLGVMETDSRGRGAIILSRGDDNPNHTPFPDGLTQLDPSMELIIGDLVRNQLSRVSKLEDNRESIRSLDDTSGAMELSAMFRGSTGPLGSAEFEMESEGGNIKQKFKVELESLPPTATFKIKVDGFEIGSMTTDSRGRVKATWTTNPKDPADLELPDNFPSLNEGSIVEVGSISSVFRKSS